jgi:hypothetical protein
VTSAQVDNTNNVTLSGGNLTVTGNSLSLQNGRLITGANRVILPAGASVARLNGYVHGQLQKNVSTGTNVARQFEVGDASGYTPVQLTFANVSVGGDLTGTTTGGEHGSIGTSGINASKDVNRSWSLTNSGITFTTYSPTFNFLAGDVDGGANTANFSVRRFNSPNWFATTTGTRTATSTQATGVNSFSDFAVGELTNWTINATANAGGTISPSGSVSVPDGGSQAFTITPGSCAVINDVTVDGNSVGAVSSYTFTNVTGNHTISASFAQPTYTINASAGPGGFISPSGAVSVSCGQNVSFGFMPSFCNHVADVVVDGVSQGPLPSYQFNNVQANHTISVSFAPTTYTILSTAGPAARSARAARSRSAAATTRRSRSRRRAATRSRTSPWTTARSAW